MRVRLVRASSGAVGDDSGSIRVDEGCDAVQRGLHVVASRRHKGYISGGEKDFDLLVLAHGLKVGLGLGLAFWRQGDKTWRRIEEPMTEPDRMFSGKYYSNIGRYKGKLYAIVGWGGNLWEWDPRTCRFVRIALGLWGSMNYMPYLVESSNGDLLIIIRLARYNDYWAHTAFSVCRVDVANQKYENVLTMENDAAFVGDNVSVAVSADEFPAGVFKPNCIYYTDDCPTWLEKNWENNDPNKITYKGGGKSMGVFDYWHKSNKRFKLDSTRILPWPYCNHSSRSELKSLSNKCPPLWIFPWS